MPAATRWKYAVGCDPFSSAVRCRRQQRLSERVVSGGKAVETIAARRERGCHVAAEKSRSGSRRSRRVGQHAAAMAVATEMEAAERVGAAEVQLCGVVLVVLDREHAGSVGNNVPRCIDV